MANGPSIKVREASTPLLNESENKNNGSSNKIMLFIGAIVLLGLLGFAGTSQRQQGGVSVQKHLSSGIDAPSNSDCIGWDPFMNVEQSKQYTFCNKASNPLKTEYFAPVMIPTKRWLFRCTFRAPIAMGYKGDITLAKFNFIPADGSKAKPLAIKYTPQKEKVAMDDYFKPFGGSDAAAVDQIFGATQSVGAYWTVSLSHEGAGKHRFAIEFAGDGISPTSRFGVVQSQTAVMNGKFELASLDKSVVCAGITTPKPGIGAQFAECGSSTIRINDDEAKISAQKDEIPQKKVEREVGEKKTDEKKELKKEELQKNVKADEQSNVAKELKKKSPKVKSDQTDAAKPDQANQAKHD